MRRENGLTKDRWLDTGNGWNKMAYSAGAKSYWIHPDGDNRLHQKRKENA